MYCRLCGEHLYKQITWVNLFKFNYNVHYECEEKMKRNDDYITFPLLDKLVMMDYLFEERYEKSDDDFLNDNYFKFLYERMLKNREWSIVIIVDTKLSSEDVILVTKLASSKILFIRLFNENFM